MKTATCFLILLVLPLAAAEEITVSPRIDSVGLFKNSVAVIHASFEVKGPGVYCWEDLPRAIHGSFWVESEGQVGIRSTTRMVEDPDAALPTGTLQRDLAGVPVTVLLKSGAAAQDPVIMGKVLTLPEATPRKTWTHDLTAPDPWAGWRISMPSQASAQAQASSGNFLVLESPEGGWKYLDLASISSVSTEGPVTGVKRKVEKPVMLFEIAQVPPNGGRVEISYLARGIAWAPSYRIDLSGPEELSIRRSAVVRNELIDLKDTEVELISGFPNIEFAHVDSPLWAGGSLASFFQQLGQQPGGRSAAATQQMVMYNSSSASSWPAMPSLPDLAKAEESAGDDIHFESIGHRSLAPGDSLSLEIASAKAACQRVVEWVVPDPRDESGRYRRDNSGSTPNGDDSPWDALKFTNPFKFPLTTGPAMITEGGHFRGQSMSQWVNPGQSSCLRITKALSVDARHTESEEEQQREIVWIGGNDFDRTKVRGSLTVHNFRSKEAVMSIRACFSGEMIEAEGEPATRLRTEGVTSVNPRRELEWTVKLAPGEEKTLNYRYSVLVDR